MLRRVCSCIILATIETAVDDLLDATTQGLEEGSNNECGNDNRHVVILVDDTAKEKLQRDDQPHVEQGKDGSEQTIHQGAVDDRIDIPEMRSQYGNANRYRNDQHDYVVSGIDHQSQVMDSVSGVKKRHDHLYLIVRSPRRSLC